MDFTLRAIHKIVNEIHKTVSSYKSLEKKRRENIDKISEKLDVVVEHCMIDSLREKTDYYNLHSRIDVYDIVAFKKGVCNDERDEFRYFIVKSRVDSEDFSDVVLAPLVGNNDRVEGTRIDVNKVVKINI